MEDDDWDEPDDTGHVIASFTVFSPTPIDALAEHLVVRDPPEDAHRYDFGTVTFNELDAYRRADRLRETIDAFLNRLVDVPREDLHASGAFVRLFITFPRGAETIQAQTVQRLAEVNATIWIDA